jgi:hypothetical protein
MGDKPFSEVYPNLYRIARRKAGTVANVLWTAPLNVSFRQDLVRENLSSWYELMSKIILVHLTNGNDMFQWNLNKNDKFTVRSMYRSMIWQ